MQRKMSKEDVPEDARIGIFLRMRPTPHRTSQVVADSEAHWIEFHTPKDATQGLVNNSREVYRFPFDGVLPPECQQGEAYERIAAPVLAAALDGYSGTVFAYGQTGSGKTFTMTGGTERYADRGLIPRSLAALFGEIAARGRDVTYTIHLSYLQIYNEVGHDLLNPGCEVRLLEDLPRVAVLEDEAGATQVRNLSMHRTANEEQALNLLFLGDTNRAVAETPLNQASSRSHAIFSLHIEARRAGEAVVRRSRLNFVDLAGSERVSKTGLEAAAQLREAKHINLSLHFLEQVIIHLQERRSHVPYRNSLLTQLLKDSLGGSCRTVMVATVAPEAAHVEESIATCRFAQRVAQISNKLSRNEEVDLPALIRNLQAENLLLRQELQLTKEAGLGAMVGQEGSCSKQEPAIAGGEGVRDSALELRRELTEGERQKLVRQLRAYLDDPSPDAVLGLEASMLFISNAFAMMKSLLRGPGADGRRQRGNPVAMLEALAGGGGQQAEEFTEEEDSKQEVDALRVALLQKQRELDVLVGVLNKQGLLPVTGGSGTTSVRQPARQQLTSSAGAGSMLRQPSTATHAGTGGTCELQQPASQMPPTPITMELLQDKNKAFEYFCTSSPTHDAVQENKALLRAKYDSARTLASKISAGKQQIAQLRSRLEQRRLQQSMDVLLAGQQHGRAQQSSGGSRSTATGVTAEDEGEEQRQIRLQIEKGKAAYKEAVGQLSGVKQEVEELQTVLEHSRARLQRDFQVWWGVVSSAAQIGAAEEAPAVSNAAAATSWTQPAGSTKVKAQLVVSDQQVDVGSCALPTSSTMDRSIRCTNVEPPDSQHQQQHDAQSERQRIIVVQQQEQQSARRHDAISQREIAAAGQLSFAGWAGSDSSFIFKRGETVPNRSSSSRGVGSTSKPRDPATGQLQSLAVAGDISTQQRPSSRPVTAALVADDHGSVVTERPQKPVELPKLVADVDPEVLAAARPLLTGDPVADSDIIKFYQARAALLQSQALF